MGLDKGDNSSHYLWKNAIIDYKRTKKFIKSYTENIKLNDYDFVIKYNDNAKMISFEYIPKLKFFQISRINSRSDILLISAQSNEN